MKKIFTLALLIILSSCKGDKKTYPSVNQIETKGVGKIKTEDLDNQAKIRKQITDYLTSYTNGDSKKALSYCYPDLFEFMQRQSPNKNSIKQMKAIFAESADILKEMSKKGFEYKFEIGDVSKLAEKDNFKIYLVTTYLIAKKGLNSTRQGGNQIAISVDNGMTWKFLEKDVDQNYIEILKMSIPKDVINQLNS